DRGRRQCTRPAQRGGTGGNFTNSTLANQAGPVIRVGRGANKNVNLTDSTRTAGSRDGRWLYVQNRSIHASVIASNSTLRGSAVTDMGSTSTLTLNGTTWFMTGNSNVTNLINKSNSLRPSAVCSRR